MEWIDDSELDQLSTAVVDAGIALRVYTKRYRCVGPWVAVIRVAQLKINRK